ncbi:hypothetical protein BJY00DRAFT_226598 [Aspergillus carlsbadensis]|nr:hypothetical protein BJY00DRAFT_226598 [Aspergillus carlsbadensis]
MTRISIRILRSRRFSCPSKPARLIEWDFRDRENMLHLKLRLTIQTLALGRNLCLSVIVEAKVIQLLHKLERLRVCAVLDSALVAWSPAPLQAKDSKPHQQCI